MLQSHLYRLGSINNGYSKTVKTYLLLKFFSFIVQIFELTIELFQFRGFLALKLFHLFVEVGFVLKLDGLDLLHDVLLEVHVAVVHVVGHLFHAAFHFDSVRAHSSFREVGRQSLVSG